MDNKDQDENLKIISGDGTDLNISTVYEHTKTTTSLKDDEEKEKKEIVIPKGSSDKKTD